MFARTDRLVLRRFQPPDAEQFAAYRSDPQVARFQSWDAPLPLAEAQQTVERFAQGDPEAPGWFQYAVDLDGVLIGDLGLNLHENLMQADLGFTLASEHQGRVDRRLAVRTAPRRLPQPTAAHARAVRLIEPSAAIGSRARTASRSAS